MNNIACNYRSIYTDSGDRGADMADHMRAAHPDHTHVWVDSPYDWEQVGETYIIPLSGGVRGIRTVAVQRCATCRISEKDVVTCQ